jgi:hypothetical protein
MAEFKGFVGPAYTADSLLADAQSSINLYLEAIESGDGQNVAYLRETPGISAAVTLPHSPVRGIWVGEGRLFAVGGSKLYEVFENNNVTEIGDVGNDNLPVQMFPNGNQLFVVSDGKAWVAVSESSVVQAVYPNRLGHISIDDTGLVCTWIDGPKFDAVMETDPGVIFIDTVSYGVASVDSDTQLTLSSAAPTSANSPYQAACRSAGSTHTVAVVPVTASQGTYLDGVFIVSKPNTKQMNSSAVDDGTTWSLDDFAYKQSYPDNIQSLLADHEELYVFGTTEATEVWQTNSAATAFTCQRNTGLIMHHGCIARYSPVRLGEGIAWLGGTSRGGPVAYRASGSAPARVSTHAIEAIWRSYSDASDAVSYVYEEDGHEFWVINFPTGNATWAYDATAGVWHRRGWWNGTGFDRQRQMFHGYCFGKHYVGDWETGKLYIQSIDTGDDDGTDIYRQRAAPHLNNEHKWSFYDYFELLTDAASSVTFTLDWSDDGGKTWHSGKTRQPVGVTGQALRAIWRRLGRSRDRIWRVTWSAATKTSIVSAYLGVGAGAA